jgi:hypothetical protein
MGVKEELERQRFNRFDAFLSCAMQSAWADCIALISGDDGLGDAGAF